MMVELRAVVPCEPEMRLRHPGIPKPEGDPATLEIGELPGQQLQPRTLRTGMATIQQQVSDLRRVLVGDFEPLDDRERQCLLREPGDALFQIVERERPDRGRLCPEQQVSRPDRSCGQYAAASALEH